MKKTNVDALFLGPKSENHRFFKEMLDFMIEKEKKGARQKIKIRKNQ
jgi:hypothetical protein